MRGFLELFRATAVLCALVAASLAWASASVPPECLAQIVAELGPGGDTLGPTPAMEALEARGATRLLTARLELRTPRREDLSELLPIFRHGPTVRFTWFDWGDDFWNLGRLGARYESFARSALDGHRHDFFLRRREDGALIGRCALYPGVGPGSWEFGITLHEPYWGQRYAAETIEAIFRFVFVDLGGTEVRFRTEPENEKMLKQYERLAIPKVIDAADDVPEPPLFHRYHHFALGADAWRARGQ